MDIDFILTGQRIREARRFRGWTADFLAEKVGLATESLRHIENASSKPSLQTLFKIATELDVSLDYGAFHVKKLFDGNNMYVFRIGIWKHIFIS